VFAFVTVICDYRQQSIHVATARKHIKLTYAGVSEAAAVSAAAAGTQGRPHVDS